MVFKHINIVKVIKIASQCIIDNTPCFAIWVHWYTFSLFLIHISIVRLKILTIVLNILPVLRMVIQLDHMTLLQSYNIVYDTFFDGEEDTIIIEIYIKNKKSRNSLWSLSSIIIEESALKEMTFIVPSSDRKKFYANFFANTCI
jgi:hypothetical protein